MSETLPGMKILYKEGKIKRASIKPLSYIIIESTALDGQLFQDKFTLRGSLTARSFKIFTEMQKHLDTSETNGETDSVNVVTEKPTKPIPENLEEALSEEQINALIELFPEFFMSLMVKSDPETTLHDVEEFDTMLKLTILGIMINKMNIEQQVENATKK